MKRVLFILVYLFLSPLPLSANSPFDNLKISNPLLPPIKVSVATNKPLVSRGEVFDFHMSIFIEEGWHIYSFMPFQGSESLTTQILLNENVFKEESGWKEPNPVLIEDGAVGRIVKGHKGQIELVKTFYVPIEVEPEKYSLGGNLVYRACDNRICTLSRKFPFHTEIEVSRK